MTTPRISAVIPAYNSARYIAAAIASIRAQSTPIAEIIVVDDGSTDATAQVVTDLGRDLCYVRQDNAGPAAARNRGIERASGDWVAFLDADDVWTATKTEQQLAALRKHPELTLIAGDMAETDAGGTIVVPSVLARHRLLDGFRGLGGGPLPNAVAALLRTNFIPTGTVLVRRDALRACGGFNQTLRYGEDLELWARIATRHPVTCLAEVLLLRRQHGANTTTATAPLLSDLVKVMQTVRAWGRDTLRAQGMDPDRLVADAWANLGYWQFHVGQAELARDAFRRSLAEAVTIRGLAYFLICALLPPPLAYRLRRLKQKIAGTGA